jgi:hypothetical protein
MVARWFSVHKYCPPKVEGYVITNIAFKYDHVTNGPQFEPVSLQIISQMPLSFS